MRNKVITLLDNEYSRLTELKKASLNALYPQEQLIYKHTIQQETILKLKSQILKLEE